MPRGQNQKLKLYYLAKIMTEETDVLREDVIVPEDIVSKQDALKNSPVKDSDYFKVPRVVDKG